MRRASLEFALFKNQRPLRHQLNRPEGSFIMYWRTLFSSAPAVLIISFTTDIIAASATTTGKPFACERQLEATVLKISLLLCFHIAPYIWAQIIARSLRVTPTTANLSALLSALRTPLSLWTALCLSIGWWLWPALNCNEDTSFIRVPSKGADCRYKPSPEPQNHLCKSSGGLMDGSRTPDNAWSLVSTRTTAAGFRY